MGLRRRPTTRRVALRLVAFGDRLARRINDLEKLSRTSMTAFEEGRIGLENGWNRVVLGRIQNPVRGILHGTAALVSAAGLIALVARSNGAGTTLAAPVCCCQPLRVVGHGLCISWRHHQLVKSECRRQFQRSLPAPIRRSTDRRSSPSIGLCIGSFDRHLK